MIAWTENLAGTAPATGVSNRPMPLTAAGNRVDQICVPVPAFSSTAVGSPVPTTIRASVPAPHATAEQGGFRQGTSTVQSCFPVPASRASVPAPSLTTTMVCDVPSLRVTLRSTAGVSASGGAEPRVRVPLQRGAPEHPLSRVMAPLSDTTTTFCPSCSVPPSSRTGEPGSGPPVLKDQSSIPRTGSTPYTLPSPEPTTTA